jgi:hypothetical protein
MKYLAIGGKIILKWILKICVKGVGRTHSDHNRGKWEFL